MWFGVLGPVEVRRDGVEVGPLRPRHRALLGLLLLYGGHVVAVDQIIEDVWGGTPPGTAKAQIQAWVAALRRSLGAASGLVLTRPSGYAVIVNTARVDLHRFEELVARARRVHDTGERVAGLRAALELWRGPAFGGVQAAYVDGVRVRLDEERLAAAEDLHDAELDMGRHAELVAGLASLVRAHPLRQRLRGQLMLALYRTGRQAEALDAYREGHSLLVNEHGLDPSPALRELSQAIARGDPTIGPPPARLLAGQPRPADVSAAPAVRDRPAQLPCDVPAFIGRRSELAELDGLLAGADGSSTAVVISAVSGAAGVGKTALAVHWAHRVRDRFPDGQLYVDLRGYDPERPLPPADALAAFLRALGVAGADLPPDLDERAARYRTLMAGRRMLVVLDNASSVEQVRWLVPGTPSCQVVVTSRDRLVGLVARHGARRLDVDLLPAEDAVALLRTLIGTRVDADPLAALALVEQCSRLPLALRIAAEFAAARPWCDLRTLTRELTDERRRLEVLDAGGDGRTAIRAVFSWSYRNLAVDAARVFRLLGLHPGRDFDAHAVAALGGTTVEQAVQVLDTLTRGHLVHRRSGAGRYEMHDLLRIYAAELVGLDSDCDRVAAVDRLLDYYLASAALACELVYPAVRRPPTTPPGAPAPPFADPCGARAWLDSERPNLLALTGVRERPEHAVRLAAVLWRHLHAGGHLTEAHTVHVKAVEAARRVGDRASEGTALTNLGVIYWTWGRYGEAAGRFRQALAVTRDCGDRLEEARALHNLGGIHWQWGRTGQAVRFLQQALAIARETGDSGLEADALDNLGHIFQRQGRYDDAFDHFERALAIARRTSNRTNEAWTLDSLGDTYQRRGEYDRALPCHRQALAIGIAIGDRAREATALGNLGLVYTHRGLHELATEHLHHALDIARELGDRDCEARTLGYLGAVYERTGDYEQAFDHHRQALTIARETGHRGREVGTLNDLGRASHAAGRPRDARIHHETALTRAEEIGDRYEQARAHDGIALALHLDGQDDQARRHWRLALTHHTDLNLPEADEVRSRLATLDSTAPLVQR
jgi:DNA-binding SARP family transcriptional activator/Tfp pilus assembly protein PilF